MAINTQYFYLDGEDSRDRGIYLSSSVQIGGAQPIVDTVSVPGRSGELVIYDGGYRNVSFQVECFIHGRTVGTDLSDVIRWVVQPGYRRLEFPWEDGYRMGYVTTGPETEARAKILRTFELEFSCKPQVFLYEGEQVIKMTAGGSLYNPWMPALPQITVYGSGAGSLTVGNVTVTLKDIDEYITLDSDIQDAFRGTANKNSTITAPEFPVLQTGDNTIAWSGGVTSVEILPRWWHL